MLFGRIAGWLMVVGGIALFVRYYFDTDSAGTSASGAVNDFFHPDSAARVALSQHSLGDSMSAMMVSGWGASLLLLFGILLVWGCRRPRVRR
jgi:hypothetical protein